LVTVLVLPVAEHVRVYVSVPAVLGVTDMVPLVF
jgi:hypothetical protein